LHLKILVAVVAFGGAAARLPAQSPASARSSVASLVLRLASQGGNFAETWAAGDYDGDRAPFASLDTLFAGHPDSVLVSLVDCFTDSTPTTVRFQHRPVVRGAICYIYLQNLVYREIDPAEHWPGNFYEHPTMTRLRAAQRAWRQAVRRHWYVAS